MFIGRVGGLTIIYATMSGYKIQCGKFPQEKFPSDNIFKEKIMKSILLIGLGRFGKHVAMHLHNLGHQVSWPLTVREERVNAVLPYVIQKHRSVTVQTSPSFPLWESAILMPASSRIGDNFQSSLEQRHS